MIAPPNIDRRDDAERVGRSERDRALRDERMRRAATAALPFSRSGAREQIAARTVVASAIASGGTMPAAMTAAMMLVATPARSTAASPAVANASGRLVDRAAEVERRRQAEDDASRTPGCRAFR